MQSLLATGLAHEACAPNAAPPYLAVRVPQYWDRGVSDDRTRYWLADDFRDDWGSGCTDVSINGSTVTYRLRAYVQFTGTVEISDPTDALAGLEAGHFVAHFCDHGCWYTADDSRVTRVLPEGAMATAFPYICFFERADAVAPAWEPWQPNPTAAAAHTRARCPVAHRRTFPVIYLCCTPAQGVCVRRGEEPRRRLATVCHARDCGVRTSTGTGRLVCAPPASLVQPPQRLLVA